LDSRTKGFDELVSYNKRADPVGFDVGQGAGDQSYIMALDCRQEFIDDTCRCKSKRSFY
jgi:hypothetical protein